MAFVVVADTGKPGSGAFRADKATKQDALLTAIDLLGQGVANVVIMDENGRAFTTLEFAKATFGEAR